MKYAIIMIIVSAMTLAYCSSTHGTYRSETDISGAKVLIGRITRPALEADSSFAWFAAGYKRYVPDAPVLERLKASAKDLRFVMFIGTWCSDSKAEVPKFFKFFDALDIPADHIEMYGVNRMKKTDGNDAERYAISLVPTLIVYSGSTEVGRIVEQPREGIEEDIRIMLAHAH